jgi:hypothetical protein
MLRPQLLRTPPQAGRQQGQRSALIGEADGFGHRHRIDAMGDAGQARLGLMRIAGMPSGAAGRGAEAQLRHGPQRLRQQQAAPAEQRHLQRRQPPGELRLG